MRTLFSCVAVLILGAAAVRATEPCTTGSAPEPSRPPCSTSAAVESCTPTVIKAAPCKVAVCPTVSAAAVRHKTTARAELLQIIADTDSPDTFMAAVVALGRVEDVHNRTLPIIVRKAAALGVLKGIAEAEQLTPVQMAVMDYLMGNPPSDAPVPPPPAPAAVAWPTAPPPVPVAPAPLAVFRNWLSNPNTPNDDPTASKH
jgi:hypothetical protein